MLKLKVGDRVTCLIKNLIVINPYSSNYDKIEVFEIIATKDTGYYLYVPPYYLIDGTIKVDRFFCNNLNIDLKYVGDNFLFVEEKMIYNVKSTPDGCICIKCKKFHPMVEPSTTFICWECKNFSM